MAHLTEDEFGAAISDALDSIPDELADELENVVIVAEDEPTEEQLEFSEYGTTAGDDLLGLYDGVAMTERGDSYGAGDEWPDEIIIFKNPHERLGLSRKDTLEEVRKTVIHEVGHYFGMDEDQLDDMGYA